MSLASPKKSARVDQQAGDLGEKLMLQFMFKYSLGEEFPLPRGTSLSIFLSRPSVNRTRPIHITDDPLLH